MSGAGFDLNALGAVITIDVSDFVAENGGEFVLGVEKGKETFAEENVAAGKGEGVDHFGIRQKVEAIGKAAARAYGEAFTDALKIIGGGAVVVRLSGEGVTLRHVVADGNLFGVGEAGQAHGQTRGFALRIGEEIEQGTRTDFGIFAAQLANQQGGKPEDEHEQKWKPFFHRLRDTGEWLLCTSCRDTRRGAWPRPSR